MLLTLTQKPSFLFTVFVCCFSMCSCDGGIRVKGHVYAQKSTVGDSQAFIDQANPVHTDLIPIRDAKVTLYHAGDYSRDKVERSELRKNSTLTGSDGSFEVGGLTSPFRFNAGLVVEKSGYKAITKVFYHDKLEHAAIIILVPDVATSAPGNR